MADAEFHRNNPEISKSINISGYKFIKNFD